MPPKAKDKKGKQELLPTGVDYTRRYAVIELKLVLVSWIDAIVGWRS